MISCSWLLLAFILLPLVLIAATARQNRRLMQGDGRRQCRQCGAVYSADARFCGRCGRPF